MNRLAVAVVLVAVVAAAVPGLARRLDPFVHDGLEPAGHVDHPTGAGLALSDGLAVVTGIGDGAFTADVRDPEDPAKRATFDVDARDVELLDVDGRRVAVLATGAEELVVADVSDPAGPTVTGRVDLGGSSHNVGVHAPAGRAYVARGTGSGIDVVDVSDPDDPRVVDVWTRGDAKCHDIQVRPAQDRAYCAAYDETLILDVVEPDDPEVLATVVNDHLTVHHWATSARGGDVLVLGDEDLENDPARCERDGPHPDRAGTLWFYDISDPTDPVLMSNLPSPEAPDATYCSAHFGRVVDDDRLVVGWYDAGTLLVDFEDLRDPSIAGRFDALSRVWDAHEAGGYVFAGDVGRGLDVLEIAAG